EMPLEHSLDMRALGAGELVHGMRQLEQQRARRHVQLLLRCLRRSWLRAATVDVDGDVTLKERADGIEHYMRLRACGSGKVAMPTIPCKPAQQPARFFPLCESPPFLLEADMIDRI